MSTPSETRPFCWSVRRELWENRSVWIAPAAVAVLGFVAFLVTLPTLPRNVRALTGPDMESAHMVVHGPYGAIVIVAWVAAFVVGVFYCVDALQGERRDRSILFWKSLPVSDRTTVLAKASVPLVVLPLIVLGVHVAAHAIMLLVSVPILWATGTSVGPLLTNVTPVRATVTVIYGLVAITLWHAPIYGWLLLVSAWARRAALVWAVLPLVAIAGIEGVLFRTTRFLVFLQDLLVGWAAQGFDFPVNDVAMTEDAMTDLLGLLTPGQFVSTPSVWVGLALTVVLLAVTVRLRRYREPN